MKKMIFSLFLISQALTSNAQSVSPENDTGKLYLGDQNNIPNAAVQAGVALFSSFKKSKISNDSISGICTLNDGTCNVAEVALYKKDQRIYLTTLTSMGTFKIPDLKPNENYILN